MDNTWYGWKYRKQMEKVKKKIIQTRYCAKVQAIKSKYISGSSGKNNMQLANTFGINTGGDNSGSNVFQDTNRKK